MSSPGFCAACCRSDLGAQPATAQPGPQVCHLPSQPLLPARHLPALRQLRSPRCCDPEFTPTHLFLGPMQSPAAATPASTPATPAAASPTPASASSASATPTPTPSPTSQVSPALQRADLLSSIVPGLAIVVNYRRRQPVAMLSRA